MPEYNKTFSSRVLKNGKITVPHEIRKLHEINEDDILTLTICSISKEKKKV